MITKKRRAKDARLRREFHITLEQYNQALKEQKGCCAICQRKVNKKGAPLLLAVDHCHTTGLVRNLLCWQCNKGIAVFQDNPVWLARAAKVLELPTFVKLFGTIYTAPGRVGTKIRAKLLAKMKQTKAE